MPNGRKPCGFVKGGSTSVPKSAEAPAFAKWRKPEQSQRSGSPNFRKDRKPRCSKMGTGPGVSKGAAKALRSQRAEGLTVPKGAKARGFPKWCKPRHSKRSKSPTFRQTGEP